MSITITIANNEKYLRENAPESITREYLDPNDEYDAEAIRCGYYPNGYREYFPFEMNLANANFSDLWEALGLDFDYSGQIDADIVLAALNKFSAKKLVSNGYEDGIVFFGGRSTQQVANYYWNLNKIAREAKARGEQIIWA